MKKINKGLILTIIVVAILTFYIISVEKRRNAEKVNINQVCEQFINFVDEYLETGKRLENLNELMVQNKEAVQMQEKFLKTTSEKLQGEDLTITKVEKEIINIIDYVFDGNQVTVSLETTVRISGKYLDENPKEKEAQSSLTNVYDDIILQQVDGEWKIVQSDLRYVDYSKFYEDTMFMY
ncbi:MAG: hypothetical protein IJE68_04270 [Clostridia bacterium]|nr:hypothetical protein [Clostridia bacterium]